MQMKTTKTASKVKAATVGAGVGTGAGAASAEIIIYLIETLGRTDIPGNIETAITVIAIPIFAGLFAWLAGYIKRPAMRDTTIAETQEQVKA